MEEGSIEREAGVFFLTRLLEDLEFDEDLDLDLDFERLLDLLTLCLPLSSVVVSSCE